MTQTEITTFINDYQNRFGENLGSMLEALPKPMTSTAFVNRVELLIELLLGKSPTYNPDKLSTFQRNQIHLAQLEQAFYMVHTEDYSIISGIDFANGQVVDKKQINTRIYSKVAYEVLEDSGLLYSGFRKSASLWDLF